MDNFEYSIQLNDRDWAEFYLAAEECNLIQPALATAEEQLLSDLEEGEVEEGKLFRVRVGPALAHSSASHLPRAAPGGHLLAEETWSGSEDETDLSSVNRFLCKNSQLGTVCPQSSESQENQQSRVTLKPPGSKLASATQCDILCAAEERESDIEDQPSSFSVVAGVVRKEDLQGQNPKQEIKERLACATRTHLNASEKMDNQEGSSTLSLAPQHPQGDASQRAPVDNQLPTLLGNTAVGGNPEFLEPRDLAGYPRSVQFSSLDSAKREGPEHLEKGTMTYQVTLMAKSVPCQEEPPAFHGHSVLAPTDPLSESRMESAERRSSKAEKDVANCRGEGRVDTSEDVTCDVLKEECPLDHVVSPTSEVVEPEDKYLRPTPTVDDSSKTLDKHRDTASLTRGPEKKNSGESFHHLGMAVPLEEESHLLAPGSQRADFFQEAIHCSPALETSPESNVTVMTWPEMCDCFFCDDTQEQGGKMGERMGKERLVPNRDPSLPEMYGPDMYEYFFNEMGEAKARGGDGGTKLEKISSSGHQSAPPEDSEDPDSHPADCAMQISIPEVYEHFFVSRTKDKRTWRGFFLSMPASEAKKAARALTSLFLKPVHLFKSRPTRQGALLRRGSQGRLVLLSPRLLQAYQPRAEDPATAVMVPERPLQPVFSQRDMCLGFVAFASWAVKTSNLQSPDAWKIVFLANFGTLSAIRYFRRQVVTGGKHGT
ncbi:PGC-1 and ERR-induced regulator in muscle protein 1 [Tiliqua scincoides]|uniref:PGC-1 and ERR-induced regulator in muscle protein 1 n=1 Tax=Tiliqua scincoides TaxID=71010 RepID=UPI0034636F75